MNVRRWMMTLGLGLLLAACGTSEVVRPPTLTPPGVMPKLLATVFVSPTPNADEMQATLVANPPTATVFVAPTATATPYVGVFLGEAEAAGDGGPVIPPALLDAPTPVIPVVATNLVECPAVRDAMFGTRWYEDVELANRLGCPIEGTASFDGTLQIFERGVMYFRPTGEIWAIAPAMSRYWYAENAPAVQPGDILVPEGMMAPSLGFGAVWRGLPGVQDALGFARTPEGSVKLTIQRFQNGTLLGDGSSGQVFVLMADGQSYGPY